MRPFAWPIRAVPLALLTTLIGSGDAAAQWPGGGRALHVGGSYRHLPSPRHGPTTPAPPRPVPRPAPRADPYAGWRSIEPRRWPPIAWPPRAAPRAAKAQPTAPDPSAACIVRLAAMGIEATPAALRPSAPPGAPGCVIPTPVRLLAVSLPRGKPVTIAGQPEVDCGMAEQFGAFVREIVAPLAVGHLGTPLATVTAGGFYCRPVDSIPGEKLSPHAIGIAIDVMGFGFADGRRLDIGKAGPAEADAFFKAVRTAACGYFTTVLGPGQPFHDTHMHVDLKKHGSSDNYRICQ